RVKEEIRHGKKVFTAVDDGFRKAFPSIFDSNLNTLIVCAILGIFGTGLVRGFAITLAVGVAVSFFSAIVVTRELLNATLKFESLRKPILYGVEDTRNVNL
ncbi:MAG TPA: MMPL family transporter, partial [Vampirovibrionales bacterium]